VSDSAYESPNDSVHNLHTKGLRFQLSFRHQLNSEEKKIQEKLFKNLIANHLVQEIKHGIIRRYVRRIARVDGPFCSGKRNYKCLQIRKVSNNNFELHNRYDPLFQIYHSVLQGVAKSCVQLFSRNLLIYFFHVPIYI
jgi:hypothetical protein